MRFIRSFIFSIILIIAGLVIYVYTGNFNIAATEPDTPLVKWVFDTAKTYSIKKHSEGIDRPSLNDEELVLSGFKLYKDMCAGCHGAPGKKPAEGFNPSPPELSDEAEEFSSSELFWIIKNGIKMTGMPAFKLKLSDQEIWSVVAFIKRLPDMTSGEYDLMVIGEDFDTGAQQDKEAGDF